MSLPRPDYEALDASARPYTRPARVIGELPTPADREAACAEATDAIARLLDMPAQRRIGFGVPVFEAFMTAAQARRHAQCTLLGVRGAEVPLDLCPSYS